MDGEKRKCSFLHRKEEIDWAPTETNKLQDLQKQGKARVDGQTDRCQNEETHQYIDRRHQGVEGLELAERPVSKNPSRGNGKKTRKGRKREKVIGKAKVVLSDGNAHEQRKQFLASNKQPPVVLNARGLARKRNTDSGDRLKQSCPCLQGGRRRHEALAPTLAEASGQEFNAATSVHSFELGLCGYRLSRQLEA